MKIAEAGREATAPRPEEGGRYDGFVSYQRRDVAAVERIRDALRDRDKHVWMDVDDGNIPAGTKWEDRIARGIEACNAFIFVISHGSADSAVCHEELASAVALHKLIIPVMHEYVQPSQLPEAVAQTQWIDLHENDAWDAGIDKLVEALEEDVLWRDHHTRYAGLAREWLNADRDGSYLLRGSDLRDAEVWLAQQEGHRAQPTREQREYIALSRHASARRQRILVGSLAAGLVVTTALAVLALIQRSTAVHETHVAQSQLRATQGLDLASSAQGLTGGRLDEALLLGLEASRLDPASLQSRSAMTGALEAARGSGASAILGPGDDDQPVNAVAFSPDGQLLAVGGVDGQVRVYDVAQQRLLGTTTVVNTAGEDNGLTNIGLYGRGVTGLAFGPGGATLVTGGGDGWVRLFDVSNGRLTPLAGAQADRGGAGGGVLSLTLARGGARVAVGDADGRVRLFAISHRRLSPLGSAPAGGGGGVLSVAFAPDGATLAAAGGGGALRLFGVSRGRLAPLGSASAANSDVINSVVFSPDGTTVAVGTGDTSGDALVQLFAVGHGRTLRPEGTIRADSRGDQTQSGVEALVFAPEGATLAAGGGDGSVRLFAVAHGTLRQVATTRADSGVDTADFGVASLAFSPGGATLAAGSGDGLVRLFAVVSGAKLAPPGILYSHGGFDTVAFAASGTTVAAGSGDGLVTLFTVSHGTLTPLVTARADSSADTAGNGVASVGFTPDGRMLAVGSGDGTVRLFAVTRGNLGLLSAVRADSSADSGHDGVESVAFSPDGATLAVGSGDGTVRLFAVTRSKLTLVASAETARGFGVKSIAFAAGGRRLAIAGDGGRVALFAVTGEKLTLLDAESAASSGSTVNSVAFAPSGAMLAAGSDDGLVRLFAVSYRKLMLMGSALADPGAVTTAVGVQTVAFAPDGATLATGDADGVVRVFAVAHRKLTALGSAPAPGDDNVWVNAVAFAPDGATLAAGSGDGLRLISIVWSDYAQLRRHVCAVVWRNLSRYEWSQLAPPGLGNPDACSVA